MSNQTNRCSCFGCGRGHFLCTEHKDVYDFIFSHIGEDRFNKFDRISKIKIGENLIDYPLESNIWQLPIDQQIEYLISAINNGEARGLVSPKTFEHWIRWKLGDEIAENYMIPYNKKIWGVGPNELDIDWLYKIPSIDTKSILQSSLSRFSRSDYFPSHSIFYYPKAGGYQAVFDAIAKSVQHIIRTKVSVESIDAKDGGYVVNGKYRCKAIINTAPWHNIVASSAVPSRIKNCISKLRNNSIVVSLHERSYDTDAHWTYVPSLDVPHHREFYIHNFAPHSGRDGVYFETNAKRWSSKVDCIHYHENEYAYPIPSIGRAENIRDILEWGAAHKIYGLGRWGQWEYFNSDVCIKEAIKLSKVLLETEL